MSIPGFEHLGVLCSALCSTPSGSTYDQGHLRLSSKHVVQLGSTVDDQISGEQAEIDGHQLEDGP